MTIEKHKASIVVVESKTCTTFICCDTCCSSFYFAAVRLFYVFLVIFPNKKHYVAAKHNFALNTAEIPVLHSLF